MLTRLRNLGSLLWQTLTAFMGDDCPRMAAALSYYTIFSLPPLLVLLLLIVGAIVDPDTARQMLAGQVGTLLGPGGADQVDALIRNASRPQLGGVTAALGILAFLFGATGAFSQLQGALNTAWGVAPDPTRGDVRNFLWKRLVSFGMILVIGFLLLVSLAVSALLTAFGDVLVSLTNARISTAVLQLVQNVLSFVAIGLLFAAIFQYVPDAVVRWRDALIGGAFTALLFTLGKAGIGYYLGRSDPGNAYGAAGSLAVTLLWIYYSAVILLLGAEFTEVWASATGRPIEPEPGAARVVREQERVLPDAAGPAPARETPDPAPSRHDHHPTRPSSFSA